MRVACLAVWAVLALPSPVRAEEKMPPARLGAFLSRILMYDADLKARAGFSLDIAVVYGAKNSQAANEARDIAGGLKALELTTIFGLPVRVRSFPVADQSDLERAMAMHHVDVLVTPDRSEEWLAVVTAVSRKSRVRTVGVASQQTKLGIAMALYLEEGKAKIAINLGASRAEGANFGVDILRLSRVLP